MHSVYIDPGHGGKDPGAMGPNGAREAEVVMSVAAKVHGLLASAGFTSVLSRSAGETLSLGGRVRAANATDSDIFVSIHCNSATRVAAGIETFCNVGSKNGVRLAGRIQEEMMSAFPNRSDRGVKQRGYYVLRKTKMAAALVELEFIHTEAGEAHLMKECVQEGCARAIYRGILSYFGMVVPSNDKKLNEPKVYGAMDALSEVAGHADAIKVLVNKVK